MLGLVLVLLGGEVAAQPAPAPAATVTTQARRGGLFLDGGMSIFEGSGIALRVDGGVPLGIRELPGLRLGASVVFDHDSEDIPLSDDEISVTTLGLMVAVSYQWVLPVTTPGQVSIVGELGLGPWIAWFNIPDEFIPDASGSETELGGRLAGSIQYQLQSGLFFSLQPLGFVFADGTAYEFSLLIGYQFP